MKSTRDPVRLLDAGSEAPGYMRAALEAAREDGPTPEQLARLESHLLPGGSSPPAAPEGPVLSLPGRRLVSKAAGIAVILALLGGGALWLALRDSPRRAAPPPTASPVDSAIEPPPAALPPPPAALPPPPAALPPPSAPSTVETAAPQLPTSASVRAATPAPAPAKSADEGESEIRLLQRAQDALGSSPARALQVTNEHITRFPRGVLVQEREVIAISALRALGRTSEARARAARFLAAYPRSAHRRRLEVLIGDLSHKDTPGAPLNP
jgi:hypothetical protein